MTKAATGQSAPTTTAATPTATARASIVGCVFALALGAALAGGCNDVFDNQGCSQNGRLYSPGSTISAERCSSCTCGADGQVHCTALPCVSENFCTFDTTYTYGSDGGNGPVRDVATLAPPSSYSLTRTSNVGPQVSADATCRPALPPCGDPGRIDPGDILSDVHQSDVLAALELATPPFFGRDERPVDGPAYAVRRADGHGLLVGAPCADGTVVNNGVSCVPIPAAVQKLVDDLRALDLQQLMDPSCPGAPPP
jgi:hypothetical protein